MDAQYFYPAYKVGPPCPLEPLTLVYLYGPEDYTQI
jgi:hypothetical protein